MTVLEIMKMNKEYCLRYDEIPNELQIKAKTLCWEYNQCSPMEDEKRKEILEKFEQHGCEDDFRRMIVLDALILNTDRHMGNYGFMVDNDTMQIKRMAPMFDHNQALLPYAEQEDFENLDVYLASRPTQIGEDFNEIAHALLTPEIRNDLKNLRGFEFQRNDEFDLPEERLQKLNKLVDQQIDGILECKRLYVPSNEYENVRYQPEQYDDLSPESKEIDEELEI